MYILRDGYTYYKGSEQYRSRGDFLLLIQPETDWQQRPFKVCVRKVALQQIGHFMMGVARVYGHSITVSGAYGHDGLPVTVPNAIYERLTVTLPSGLHDAWNKGGGHNSAGSESAAMRNWALENLTRLKK